MAARTAPVAREALLPNPMLAAFKPLIGAWNTLGEHPLVPGVTFHGRVTFDWHEGGAFVVMRSETDEPQIPSGIAVFGSDDQARVLTMLYFDERYVSRRYEAELQGNVLRWWRNAPDLSQRYTLTIASDGASAQGAGRMSHNGGPWQADLSLNLTRLGDPA